MRRARLLLVIAVALFVAACSSDDAARDAESAAATTTAKAPTTTTTLLAPGSKYVALGTSYASGTGIATQLPGGCTQSDHNYPHLLAAELDLELVDVSCGAAVMANLLDTPQGEHPPQLDTVTADTDLITITAGGNDLIYSGRALQCGDPEKPPCTVDPADLEQRTEALRGSFGRLAAELATRAPQATVVLVTYPRMLVEDCAAQGLDPDEVRQVAEVGQTLEDVSLVFAETAGWAVADPYGAAGDHSACAAGDDQWIDGQAATTGFPYHPTAAGHEAMARLTIEALADRT